MGQITQAAEILGWRWAHFRPALTKHGWRTPASGPLGKGWPDLVLVRERDGRMIFAEIKSSGGRVSDDQVAVLDMLRRIERLHGWLTVAIWRPADWDVIVEILT